MRRTADNVNISDLSKRLGQVSVDGYEHVTAAWLGGEDTHATYCRKINGENVDVGHIVYPEQIAMKKVAYGNEKPVLRVFRSKTLIDPEGSACLLIALHPAEFGFDMFEVNEDMWEPMDLDVLALLHDEELRR